MDRRLIQRGLVSVALILSGVIVMTSAGPAGAATARCRKPCSPTTSTTDTTLSTTTTVTPITTTSTTAAPTTTTSTTAAPTTTTAPPLAPSCTDGSTPIEATSTASGARIRICTTVGNWTTSAVENLLLANAQDLAVVGPRLTIEISTARPSSTGSSASCCDVNGNYYGFKATMSLNPSSTSSFANAPDAVFAHEYGHAWTSYWLYTNPANAGSWAAYRNVRWVTADGSQVLAQSSKLNTSYNWTDYEMAADDYRRLFGSAAAQAQLGYLNSSVPDPQQVPGLASWFLASWR